MEIEQHLLLIDSTIKVETENSIWILTPDKWCRMPKVEQPRPDLYTIDNTGKDGSWHEHIGVWYYTDSAGFFHIRVLPFGRHAGACGIVSGRIESIFTSLRM